MHRRYQLVEMQGAKLKSDARLDQNAEKNQSDNRSLHDTMVEAFKHLNYSQLAINSLVTKRFRNVIQTNRHSLARLYVDYIGMSSLPVCRAATKIFNKVLSHEEYNAWVIRNGYSKQTPLEDQVASTKSTQNISKVWPLNAYTFYKNPGIHRRWTDRTIVFSASEQLSHENWPLFQHFVRLITDPFIYINKVRLTYQNDVFNLLAGALNSNHSRLQCKSMTVNHRGNGQKSITWAKSHIRCNFFEFDCETVLNLDEAFADFFLTGAHCAPSIRISGNHDRCQALVNFVQKFMDLKNCDECHIVETVRCERKLDGIVDVLKRNFVDFIEKEEKERYRTTHIFEFVNDHIGMKLQLTTRHWYEINLRVISL